MSKIFIEAKPAPFSLSPFDHLYLVYQNNSGNEFVIRGGPASDNPFEFGNIFVQVNVPINLSEDRRGVQTPQQRGQRELDLDGRNADDVWHIMKQQAAEIHNSGIQYIAGAAGGGQNSNSTIASILDSVGINIFYNLPIGTGSFEFPGDSNFLDVSSVLIGSNRNDTINGGTEDDTLDGGAGNDVITGGAGRDIYIISAGNDTINDGGVGVETEEGLGVYESTAQNDNCVIDNNEIFFKICA